MSVCRYNMKNVGVGQLARYGQPCNTLTDICDRNSQCIDGICKCPFGYGILDRGNCEKLPFDLTDIHHEGPSKTTQKLTFSATTPESLSKFPNQTHLKLHNLKESIGKAVVGFSKFIDWSVTLPADQIRPMPATRGPGGFPQEAKIHPLPKNYPEDPHMQTPKVVKTDWSLTIAPNRTNYNPFYPQAAGKNGQNSNFQATLQRPEPVTITQPPPLPTTTRLFDLSLTLSQERSQNSINLNFGSLKSVQGSIDFVQNPNKMFVAGQKLTGGQENRDFGTKNTNSDGYNSYKSIPEVTKVEKPPGNYEQGAQAGLQPQISSYQTQNQPNFGLNQQNSYQNQLNLPVYTQPQLLTPSQTRFWTPQPTMATQKPYFSITDIPRPAPAQPTTVNLGQKCTQGLDICPENAICLGNCLCQQGYQEVQRKCVKYEPVQPVPIPSQPNQPIMSPIASIQPVAAPSPPIQSIPSSHTTVQGQNSLLPYGSLCSLKSDCEGGAECLDGKCRCPSKTSWKEGKCYKDSLNRGLASPGESCDRGEICTGGSMCDWSKKQCICAAHHDFVRGTCMRDDCPYMVLPGGSCTGESLCIGGSSCQNGMCTCDGQHHAVDGYCRPIAAMKDVEFVAGSGLRFSSNPQTSRRKAERCPLPEEPQKCQLPNCFCSKYGRSPPGGLDPKDIPQFIVLTFDDAVNAKTMSDYRYLFEDMQFKNPNGCPIKGTFFVSHEWTNYDDVQWVYRGGHELASNSITHGDFHGRGMTKWLNEMDGQRRIMAKFGNVPEEDIVGLRAPQLAVGGDEQFEMMSRAGFLYDNSLSANPGTRDAPYWPQTLDYRLAWQCQEKDCPESSFPGIWTIPLNQFYGSYLNEINSFKRSCMLRAVSEDNSTIDDLYQILTTNFERSYHKNRAPYVLSLNADFLQIAGTSNGLQALARFLEGVLQKHDVYVLTIKDLISWMQNPKPLDKIDQLDIFKCPNGASTFRSYAQPEKNTSAIPLCAQPNKCIFPTPFLATGEHQFQTCNPCPSMYPWIDNPMGVLEY